MSGDKEKKPRAGRKKLRDALEAAPKAPPAAKPVEPAAGPGGGDETASDRPGADDRGGDDGRAYYDPAAAVPDDWKPWHAHLPADSPMVPLGESQDYVYILDHRRFLQQIEPGTLRDMSLVKWAGGARWLVKHFTKHVRGKADATWDHTPAKEALVNACVAAGTFNPARKVRGRGCWADEDGALIVHLGHTVLRGPDDLKPGVVGGFIYPLVEPFLPSPEPLRDAAGEAIDDAGELILQHLKSWTWSRGELDAQLMLGWCVAAILSGALNWRPMVWVTGDAGTGKSTLQEFVQDLLKPGIIATANTTAAGIYQHVGLDSLPVAVDELEASAKGDRAQAIIELARQAASGAVMLRGGATHSGVQFEARSCFLFSSISIPPLAPQDLSRMAILELGELPQVSRDRDPAAPARHKSWGSALLWRLRREWPRYRTTLTAYKAALAEVGHAARGQDQFGALLACADLALNGAVPGPAAIEAEGFVTRLDARHLSETKFNTRDFERCCEHLGSRPVDLYRDGAKKTVNHWLNVARQAPEHECRGHLETFGLKLIDNPIVDRAATALRVLRGPHVAVASSHSLTSTLFYGSKWEAPAGHTGGWIGSMKRVPGAALSKKRIDGMSRNCVLVPLAAFLDLRDEHIVDDEERVSDLEAARMGAA